MSVKAYRFMEGVTVEHHKIMRRQRVRTDLFLTEPEAWDLFKQLSKLFEKRKPK